MKRPDRGDRQPQHEQRAAARRRRSAATPPPCASATWRTIASPSPEPGRPRAPGAR